MLEQELFSGDRRHELGKRLGWGEATTLGALALLWSKSRDAGFVAGRPEELFPLLPAEPRLRPALFRALVETGFVVRTEAQTFAIVGNQEHADLIAKRRAAGKQGRAKQTLVTKERLEARAKRAAAKTKPEKKPPRLKAVKALAPAQDANRAAWDAYAGAFVARWSVPPTRNARVNACIAQFVQRVGRDDAPRVLEFFVMHNDRDYLRSHHAITLAVRDAEGLHTQWKRGQAVTSQDIRRMEGGAGLADQLRRINSGEL